eukprot:jgi/Picre1/34053/NNA_001528.t1
MFQLGIFDDSKGRKEGEEAEKIVGWYPVTTEVEYQVRSIGLLQGLLQFLSIFDSAPGEVETAEFEDGYWVVGSYLFPSWLIRNFDDVLQLLLPDCPPQTFNSLINKILNYFGENLCQKGSWLRKQLRNPFCLTHGVSWTDLPPGLSGLIATKFENHADVVIFRDNTCLFSSFDDETTALLGSFVISGIYGFFWQHPAPKMMGAWAGHKSTTRLHVVDTRNKSHIFIIGQESFLVFATPTGHEPGSVSVGQIGRIVEDAIDAIQTWGGSARISNHIPGSRYCTQEDIRKRYICSPREKMMVDAFASVTEPVIHGECLYMMDQESLFPSR